MIRKRTPKTDTQQQQNFEEKPLVENRASLIKKEPAKKIQPRTNDNQNPNRIYIPADDAAINHPEFHSYEEEICYVLNLLEKQGVNIYDENRKGGMYLKQRGNLTMENIFQSNTSSNTNKQNERNSENQTKIDNKDLAAFFS